MPKEDTLPRMGWVIFLKTFDSLEEQVRFSSEDILAAWSPRANLPALAAIDWLAQRYGGKRITLLVDSECVEGALVKGASNAPDLADMVSTFWHICTVHDLATYVARVPTDSNVSDQVSRGVSLR